MYFAATTTCIAQRYTQSSNDCQQYLGNQIKMGARRVPLFTTAAVATSAAVNTHRINLHERFQDT